nr:MAG TPA: hypothetical protein [Bacteriophage sp.]
MAQFQSSVWMWLKGWAGVWWKRTPAVSLAP